MGDHRFCKKHGRFGMSTMKSVSWLHFSGLPGLQESESVHHISPYSNGLSSYRILPFQWIIIPMDYHSNGSSFQWIIIWMGYHSNGLSFQWVIIIPMDYHSNGLSFQWVIIPMDYHSNGLSFQWVIIPMDYHSNGLSFQWISCFSWLLFCGSPPIFRQTQITPFGWRNPNRLPRLPWPAGAMERWRLANLKDRIRRGVMSEHEGLTGWTFFVNWVWKM